MAIPVIRNSNAPLAQVLLKAHARLRGLSASLNRPKCNNASALSAWASWSGGDIERQTAACSKHST